MSVKGGAQPAGLFRQRPSARVYPKGPSSRTCCRSAVVKLSDELQTTTLWDNKALRKIVLEEALPKLLQKQLGLDTILSRVPESYTRAIFGAYLASRFIYKYGTSPSQFAFFTFMNPYFARIGQ
ncbi:hypothetical protein AMAG_18562 [Allomyces macrogynus ATCC 38327]|uniref:Uncharacterized protein n=1 Tax=Allomyces macrogynus (strain ATCC 38327) TaxID=578462 RepID=A0A0L0SDM9_ALLM3|nr:hypothetical protein AMAG_18562 [Allomyces macrogynus ATCC 38327]|eukprot:KNE60591.1 hypothetical protein AMAG_18562 [Allomyces macrogynus ATCC 38327]